MAVIPPNPNWIAGKPFTAALLNNQLRDALNFFLGTGSNAHPYCFAHQSAAQGIPAATQTPVTLDAESEDGDAMHNLLAGSNHYFTFQTPGVYDVKAQVCFGPTTSGADAVILQSNIGPVAKAVQPFTGTAHDVQASATLRARAGDTISIQAICTTTNTLVVGSNHTFMQARWVRN